MTDAERAFISHMIEKCPKNCAYQSWGGLCDEAITLLEAVKKERGIFVWPTDSV